MELVLFLAIAVVPLYLSRSARTWFSLRGVICVFCSADLVNPFAGLTRYLSQLMTRK